MIALLRKEIGMFFSSVAGYMAIIIFLVLTSLFIWVFKGEFNIPDGGIATLEPLFVIAPWVLLFLVPAVTMRAFSDELKSGTMELLLSRPVTLLQIVMAKYLAGVLLVAISLLFTLCSFVSVYLLGSPPGNIDIAATAGSYLGLLLLAASYAAIGVCVSSFTGNQIISFIVSAAVCFFVYAGFENITMLDIPGQAAEMISGLGISAHYESLSRGVIDTRDIIYFASLIFVFLLITRWRIENRTQKSKRKIILLISVVIIVVAGYMSSLVNARLDMTKEGRYTLNTITKEALKTLDKEVSIKIYLEGDIPLQFVRLEKAIRELLGEYKEYSGGKVSFRFINPYENENSKATTEMFRFLYEKGLQPVNIFSKDKEGGKEQKLVFPGAIIEYKDLEVVVNLLKNNPTLSSEQNLNNSIQSLEFEFTRIIATLTGRKIDKIAFIEGHGELNDISVFDISKELSHYYEIHRGVINGKPGCLDGFSAVIIAQPSEPFSETDKFVLDQYIMNGGKTAWFIDAVDINADSLRKGSVVAFNKELKLNDQLFNYGVRINYDIILDKQCIVIPVNSSPAGSQPVFTPLPWYYSPLLTTNAEHTVTKNVNVVRAGFMSSIDTLVANENLNRRILLTTSGYSGKLAAPMMISVSQAISALRTTGSNNNYAAAVMVEGIFTSNFADRNTEHYIGGSGKKFVKESKHNKMLVVSDGDIIKNDVINGNDSPEPLPLGYDRYTKKTYGNKEFIVNAINYLTNNSGLLSLRNKEFVMRLLNKPKLENEQRKWTIINMTLPPLMVIVLGILIAYYRKKKYSTGREDV